MNSGLLLGGIFASVLTGVTLLGYLFLQRQQEADAPAALPLTPDAADSSLADTFRLLGEALPAPKEKADPLREQLSLAGYRGSDAPAIFNGIKGVVALLPALLLGALTLFIREDVTIAIVVMCAAAGFGYLLPDSLLRKQVARRQRRLRRGLPVALDLLILSVETGQTLDQASAEIGRQLALSFPDLAQEFSLIHLELRTGNSRVDALRRFAQRTGEPEVRKLANLLIDGDRFGANLAPTLRTHAKYLRIRIRQQAQEQARKIGVKMVFPLVLLIFPSLLLVTLGPAILQMYATLGNMFAE